MTNNENLPKSGPGNAEAAAVSTPHAPENATKSEFTAAAPRHIPVPKSLYPVFAAVFIGVPVVSSITAIKGVEISGLATDNTFFLFPLSYVVGDVLSEYYGYEAIRRIVWTDFAILVGAMLCFFATIKLPAAPQYENQEVFVTVLGTVPQLVLAGLAGYVVGQLLNAWSLNTIKKHTDEKAFWARLMGSTVVGEFVNTLILCSIAATAINIDTWSTFVNCVIVGFVWRTAVEMVVMPATYAVVTQVKRREGYYDTHVPA